MSNIYKPKLCELYAIIIKFQDPLLKIYKTIIVKVESSKI